MPGRHRALEIRRVCLGTDLLLLRAPAPAKPGLEYDQKQEYELRVRKERAFPVFQRPVGLVS